MVNAHLYLKLLQNGIVLQAYIQWSSIPHLGSTDNQVACFQGDLYYCIKIELNLLAIHQLHYPLLPVGVRLLIPHYFRLFSSKVCFHLAREDVSVSLQGTNVLRGIYFWVNMHGHALHDLLIVVNEFYLCGFFCLFCLPFYYSLAAF